METPFPIAPGGATKRGFEFCCLSGSACSTGLWKATRKIAGRSCLLLDLLAFLLVTTIPFPSSGAPIVINGTLQEQWNDVDGKSRMRASYEFSALINGRDYLITPSVLDNTNGIAEFILGALNGDNFAFTPDPRNPQYGAATVFEGVIPRFANLACSLIWLSYVAKSGTSLDNFDILGEVSYYHTDEIRYVLQRHNDEPMLPSSVIAMSPSYYYVGEYAFRLKKKTPMPHPFENGKTLWQFHVLSWTNTSEGTFPLEFEYARPLEVQALTTVANPEDVNVTIMAMRGLTKSVQRSPPTNLNMAPVFQRVFAIRDFRFKSVLGDLPLDYRLTNKILLPKTDKQLGNLAKAARKRYAAQREYAARLPAKRTLAFLLMFALIALPFGVFALTKLRNGSSTTQQ